MNYYVSIENIPHHRWQLELLIESFKALDLQDHLVIGVADNKEVQYGGFTKNLMAHKRKFLHENYGTKKKCKPLNKPYGIFSALSNGLLKQPFVVLHPDMILIKPIEHTDDADIFFTASQENYGLQQKLQPYIEKILINRGNVENLPWVSDNGMCIFDHVSRMFFNRVLYYAEKFQTEYPDWELPHKAAWSMAFYEQYGLSVFMGKHYEINMMSNLESPHAYVIHYNRGLGSHFNKKQFLFENTLQFTFGSKDPIDALEQYNGTSAMEFISDIVRSYKKKEVIKKAVNVQMPVLDNIIEPKLPE